MYSVNTRTLFAGLLSLLFVGMQAVAEIGTALQMQLGNPSNATENASNRSHYLIQRTVQALDYNDELGEANWASWDLTANDIGSAGRSPAFITDTTLPAGFTRVTSADYTNSGFNRGHLCPSADRTRNDTDNALVFYMSNIVPQTADNNQGPWVGFETYCRTLATSGNELLIIAGGSGYTSSRIPSGKAAIPGHLWKIAVVVPPGSGTALTRITSITRVIAIKIPNVSGIRNNPWTQYVTSASQLEADTGFTFFTALPPSLAAALRAQVDGSTGPSIAGLSPSSGVVNSQVVIAGNGFSGASSVSFNGTAASFTVNSDNQITASVPPSASTGLVSVNASAGPLTSNGSFTVIDGPTIASFSTPKGRKNSTVIISGAGFSGASGVTFNGVAASFSVNSDGQLIALVPAGATSGSIGIVTASGATTSPGSFTVTTADEGRPLISQVYGSGGNSGATYRYDFIEIYNPGATPIDLGTYAVQYAAAAGSAWQATPLTGTLLPGRYCLVQQAQGTGGTQNLPTPQVVGTINLSGTSGKVALTNTRTLLTVDNPLENPALVDFVGYGTAEFFEGTAAAPLLGSTASALRTNLGGTDTDDNGTDFAVATPAPHHSTALDAWRSRTFTESELAADSISGSLANPTGDGLSNLLKYAFNLDPRKNDGPSAMTATGQVEGNDRILTLSHRKNHFAADLTYTYEVSFDLVSWTPLDAPDLEVVPLDPTTDRVTVSVVSTAPAFYLRVKSSQ